MGIEAAPFRLYRGGTQEAVIHTGDGVLSSQGTIPTTEAAALEIINSRLPSGSPALSASDVYIHVAEAANSNFIPCRWMFLHGSTLKNIARDATAGVALMSSHETGGLCDYAKLPFGTTFAGRYELLSDRSERALVASYMLRGVEPNGKNGPSTDDLHKLIEGGVLRDTSVGLWPGGDGEILCSVCNQQLQANEFGESSCGHYPGTTLGMSAEELDGQRKRGVPQGKATYALVNFGMGEMSGVYDGAVPGAGFRKVMSLSREARTPDLMNQIQEAYSFAAWPKPMETTGATWERVTTPTYTATVTRNEGLPSVTLSAPIVEPDPEAPAASFASHSDSVLAAVQEYVTRSEGYASLRAQDGRQPSPDRRADWQALYERLGVLLVNTAPRPDPLPALRLKHLSMRADLARLSVGRQP